MKIENKNAFDVLKERGFIKQTVYEDDLYKLLGKESTPFYVGFDPTADSLHIGHYIPIMAMAHMQRAGHKPIALIGGGTAMIGDPSNRTDMRKMMTKETIAGNCAAFKKQMLRGFPARYRHQFFGQQNAYGGVLQDKAGARTQFSRVQLHADAGIRFSGAVP